MSDIKIIGPLRKFWQILDAGQRRALIVLIGLMFVGMLLETLGIGLVIPVLGVVMNADLLDKYPDGRNLFVFLGYPDQSQLLISTVLILISVYLFKVLFLGFLALAQSRFVYGLQERISLRLFSHYIYQPYAFHLKRNSAQLIRNATIEVSSLSASAQSIVAILSELLVIAGIVMLLLMVEPLGTLAVVAALSVISVGYYGATRKSVLKWGGSRQLHEGMRIQHLQQGLGGIKEIQLCCRADEFIKRYDFHNHASAAANKRFAVMQQLPRLWLEFLTVFALAVLIFVMTHEGKSFASLVPVIGVFGAAAFRLMPSVNRIIGSIHNVRFAIPTIDILHEELAQGQPPSINPIVRLFDFKKEIQLNNITYKYPEGDTPVLHQISLAVERGKTVGLIGGSGAGKSTLVDIILGLLTPTRGVVSVDGIDIRSNLRSWWSQIGYVPQEIYLVDDTLSRNIAFGLSDDEIKPDQLQCAIQAAHLEDFVATLPEGLNTMVGERGVRLSGGQRQRIGIARALYHGPDVLILDEATSSLDVATETEVMKAIEALNGKKTIIIVAHRLSTVARCDWLYQIENGMVQSQGLPSAVLKN